MTTTGAVLEESVQALDQAGVDEPRFEARLLVAFALNRTPEHVFGYPEVELSLEELDHLRALVVRRVAREPLALITGEKEFWSLRFAVSVATLIPRPDSETLIEVVLKTFPDKDAPVKILDLGTGSGCLLLSLLHEYKNAWGIGVDISEAALKVARTNSENLGLGQRAEFICVDWNQGVPGLGTFDVIICNPPYVPEGDKKSLQREVVMFEPHSALFAGAEGLSEFPTIIALLSGLLGQGGAVFFEVGVGQAEIVAPLLVQAGLNSVDIMTDLAGIGRCVTAKF
ncbi:MAG: peptide chain release factor N(5)-glutamine methyltransferase [Rhodospirillales bacterium]|nr:peptide chain release factor N(5)-glutamine methyltransferase [Rhodospirillales bacterium]